MEKWGRAGSAHKKIHMANKHERCAASLVIREMNQREEVLQTHQMAKVQSLIVPVAGKNHW